MKKIKFFPREKDRKAIENENKKSIDKNEKDFISKQKKKGKSQTE